MCNDQLQSEAGAIPDADSENAPTLEGKLHHADDAQRETV